MLEQIEIFKAESYESVADRFNAWMITNGGRVDAIVEIENFTEYVANTGSMTVDDSHYHYFIRLRYQTTLAKIT